VKLTELCSEVAFPKTSLVGPPFPQDPGIRKRTTYGYSLRQVFGQGYSDPFAREQALLGDPISPICPTVSPDLGRNVKCQKLVDGLKPRRTAKGGYPGATMG
jgi:hypothetical protein